MFLWNCDLEGRRPAALMSTTAIPVLDNLHYRLDGLMLRCLRRLESPRTVDNGLSVSFEVGMMAKWMIGKTQDHGLLQPLSSNGY